MQKDNIVQINKKIDLGKTSTEQQTSKRRSKAESVVEEKAMKVVDHISKKKLSRLYLCGLMLIASILVFTGSTSTIYIGMVGSAHRMEYVNLLADQSEKSLSHLEKEKSKVLGSVNRVTISILNTLETMKKRETSSSLSGANQKGVSYNLLNNTQSSVSSASGAYKKALVPLVIKFNDDIAALKEKSLSLRNQAKEQDFTTNELKESATVLNALIVQINTTLFDIYHLATQIFSPISLSGFPTVNINEPRYSKAVRENYLKNKEIIDKAVALIPASIYFFKEVESLGYEASNLSPIILITKYYLTDIIQLTISFAVDFISPITIVLMGLAGISMGNMKIRLIARMLGLCSMLISSIGFYQLNMFNLTEVLNSITSFVLSLVLFLIYLFLLKSIDGFLSLSGTIEQLVTDRTLKGDSFVLKKIEKLEEDKRLEEEQQQPANTTNGEKS